ncbi:MAG: lytic transglycosylase domain-containing protein [Bdellovibrionales bacterium]|nr:lytic transglycosylase domain-containing protein [Bdellovibrionales bacterium]
MTARTFQNNVARNLPQPDVSAPRIMTRRNFRQYSNKSRTQRPVNVKRSVLSWKGHIRRKLVRLRKKGAEIGTISRTAPTPRFSRTPVFSFFFIVISTASAVGLLGIVVGTVSQPESSFHRGESEVYIGHRISPFELQLKKLSRQTKAEVAGQIHFIKQYIDNFSKRIDQATAKSLAIDIYVESRKTGLDPFLVTSLIQTESAFKQWARSNRSAYGLMQVQPATGKYTAQLSEISWKGGHSLLNDPKFNVRIGSAYLKYLITRFNGDVQKALMAYNWGPTNLDLALSGKKKIPSAVKHYANSILNRQTKFHLNFRQVKEQYQYMNVSYLPDSLWMDLVSPS